MWDEPKDERMHGAHRTPERMTLMIAAVGNPPAAASRIDPMPALRE